MFETITNLVRNHNGTYSFIRDGQQCLLTDVEAGIPGIIYCSRDRTSEERQRLRYQMMAINLIMVLNITILNNLHSTIVGVVIVYKL